MRRFRGLFGRRKLDRELDDEVRFHLEERTRANLAAGMAPEQARRAARLAFGNPAEIKRETRAIWTLGALERFWQDLRYATRTLAKSPGFAVVAILTLALGIGANTAIFSVVDAVMLRGLPYPASNRLVVLNEVRVRTGPISVSWPNYLDWRARNRTFDEMAAYLLRHYTLTGIGEPELPGAAEVSSSFFSLLGARPALGRLFLPADDRTGAVPSAVLSYSFWRNRLGGDPAVVGKSLELSGTAFTIAGVLPPDFQYFTERIDLYVPIGLDAANPIWLHRENHPGIVAIARLRSQVTLDAARNEMRTISEQLAAQYPKANSTQQASVTPLFEDRYGGVERTLVLLVAAVGFVLLLACANVANLFLSRALARQKEFAIRAAMGAGRARLVRQLLTESLVISVAGGGLGVLLAWWTTAPLLVLAPREIPHLAGVHLNFELLGFALGISVFSALLFGLAPALETSRLDLTSAFKTSASSSAPGWLGQRLGSGLLVAETAMALVLVIAPGLLVRSFAKAQAVKPGFEPRHVLALDVLLPAAGYPEPAQQEAFFRQAVGRVRALPGAQSASAVFCPPIAGICWGSVFTIRGRPLPSRSALPGSIFNIVFPGYFQTMQVPLLEGRTFNDGDTAESTRVAIINHALARRWWGSQSPVGRQIQQGFPEDHGPVIEIVGVTGDIKQFGPDKEEWPEVFLPATQTPANAMTIVVRTAGDPMAMAAAAVQAIRSVDHDLPVTGIQPVTESIAVALARRKFSAFLFGTFGVLALVLAAIGIYGVTSCRVERRTREMGIRMALGARRSQVLRLVVGSGARMALAGVAIGLGASFAIARLMAGMLYGIQASDPATFAGVAILLTLVALAACYVPARRATKVDPLVALREE